MIQEMLQNKIKIIMVDQSSTHNKNVLFQSDLHTWKSVEMLFNPNIVR